MYLCGVNLNNNNRKLFYHEEVFVQSTALHSHYRFGL